MGHRSRAHRPSLSAAVTEHGRSETNVDLSGMATMLNDRRTASALLRISMVALLIVVAAGTLDAKWYTAERFDSAIRVLPGGDIEVDETLVLRFVDGTFTEVFRELPTRHTDGIEVISARLDERVLPFGNGVNQLEVRNRSQVRAIWRFAPTPDRLTPSRSGTSFAGSSSNWTAATCWRGGRSPGSMPTPSDRQRSKSPRQLRCSTARCRPASRR